MSSTKERLSVTVDADLIAAGYRIVQAGQAESLSAWVNSALRAELERAEKLHALDAAIRLYEADHGELTEAEMVAAERAMQSRAIHVRPSQQR